MKRLTIFSSLLLTSIFLAACQPQEETDLYADYDVKKGQITQDKNVQVEVSDHQIWEHIKMIIPQKYLDMISKYEVVTDGADGILAYVSLNDDEKTWTFSVDLDDAVDKTGEVLPSSIGTLIHEMAHIIALNKEQMTEMDKESQGYAVDEGVFKEGAYLGDFYEQFKATYTGEEDATAQPFYIDKTKGDFEMYPEDFITAYAATNPVEDFAESFAYFVLSEKPTDESISSQKLSFFYAYPELVQIREDIRGKIDADTVLQAMKDAEAAAN